MAFCSSAADSSDSEWSDGEDEGAAAGPSGTAHESKRQRRPTKAKKTKQTLRADQLNEEQVRTVETQFGLELQPNWSLEQRQERAAATVRSVRQQLRNERHGTLADGAVSRIAMQRACELLSKIEVAGLEGASWTRRWRGKMGVAIEEKLGSMASGIGWLQGVLACKTRLAAAGGSQIGAEQSTLYGKSLRKDQQLDEGLAALKKADPQFGGWCAPPLCPPLTRLARETAPRAKWSRPSCEAGTPPHTPLHPTPHTPPHTPHPTPHPTPHSTPHPTPPHTPHPTPPHPTPHSTPPQHTPP
jgi:hypothetical protein